MAEIKSLEELKKEMMKNITKEKEENSKECNKSKKNNDNNIDKRKEIKNESIEKEIKEDKKQDEENLNIDEKQKEDIIKKVSKETNISLKAVKAVVKLIDEGNTIPFIARYRKEMTGSLDDSSLRLLEEVLKRITNVYIRKAEILRLIDEGGNLTPEIELEIEKAETLSKLEDIYRPFKGKRKTRGSEAKRKGLEPLSILVYNQDLDILTLEKKAEEFLNDEVLTVDDALSGAYDIISENISNMLEIRDVLRKLYWKNAILTSTKKAKAEDEKEIYKVYYDFKESVRTIPSHRILATLRGENEKILTVKIEIEEELALSTILKRVLKENSKIREIIENITKDSLDRLIHPSLEREIKTELKEKADKDAIEIFKSNLKSLLLSPPFKKVRIMGVDPAYRTGCKIAIIDETGKLLDYTTIYPTPPQEKIEESKKIVLDLIKKWGVNIISIGNGTASRETEQFIAETIKELTNVSYLITNEAGASVYSASKIGSEEFPDINVSIRGAVSIARRVNDPMAELVKIDPKSIGVGQYQHDVDQKKLSESLENTVEDVVNRVGVDLNTATYSLLTYIAGLSKKTAKNIVKFREQNGKFTRRDLLKKVSGIGDVSFNQSVGFLRIYDGDNILDATGIHPETYPALEEILKELDFKKEDLKDENLRNAFVLKLELVKESISKKLNIGMPTLKDIIEELKKPGRDIRDEAPKPVLRKDILTFEDLNIGTILKGTVRNATQFGVFVDIGIKNDGLVHISEMSKKFVKDPRDIVKVGDIVNVKVIDKNDKTKKVSLSMKIEE